MICLHPFGQSWLNRVQAVAHAVTLHGTAAGKLHSKDKLHLKLDNILDRHCNAGLYNAPE